MEKVLFCVDAARLKRVEKACFDMLDVLNAHKLELTPAQLIALGSGGRTYNNLIFREYFDKALEFFGYTEEGFRACPIDVQQMVFTYARGHAKPLLDLWPALMPKGGLVALNERLSLSSIFEYQNGTWQMKPKAQEYLKTHCAIYVTDTCKAFYNFVEKNKGEMKKFFHKKSHPDSWNLSAWVNGGEDMSKAAFARMFGKMRSHEGK